MESHFAEDSFSDLGQFDYQWIGIVRGDVQECDHFGSTVQLDEHSERAPHTDHPVSPAADRIPELRVFPCVFHCYLCLTLG
ncbi:hypothetical protein DNK56_09385 [Streptomyces sp. AC1-42W]|nr:hypothetical protein DNK56_09385 [Streptomyces sp. AC1-42W]